MIGLSALATPWTTATSVTRLRALTTRASTRLYLTWIRLDSGLDLTTAPACSHGGCSVRARFPRSMEIFTWTDSISSRQPAVLPVDLRLRRVKAAVDRNFPSQIGGTN